MSVANRPSSTVVVFEDNLDDELLALRALRTAGISLEVQVARDGQQAMELLGLDGSISCKRTQRPPDLIISDLKMPKLNGDSVLAATRKDAELARVPFVMLSSSDDAEDVRRCMKLGASAYCIKPVDFGEYMDCLRQIVQKWLIPEHEDETPDCELDAPLK